MQQFKRPLWIMVCLALAVAGSACKKKGQEGGGGTAEPAPAPAPVEPAAAVQPTAPAADAAPAQPVAEADAAPAAPQAEQLAPVTLAAAPTADETKAADELATKLKDEAQVGAEQTKAENARGFLILAATSADPGVVAAALRGISKTWGSGGTAVDDDCRNVVAARLGAKDHAVLGPAIEAVRAIETGSAPLGEPLGKALATLLARADDPAAQYEAAYSLSKTKDPLAVAGMPEAFLTALGAKDPFVVAQTLVTFTWFASDSMAGKDKFQPIVTELLKHADPAVRGEAAAALAKFCPWNDQEAAKPLAAQILPLLDDPNGFVRASAGNSLSSLKFKPALHAIVKHLDDPANCTYDTPAWTTLWDGQGWDHHDGSAWDRVDDAMLYAIAQMTYFDEGPMKFEYTINTGTVEADIAKAVADAKAWYEAHKADIPPLEEPAPAAPTEPTPAT